MSSIEVTEHNLAPVQYEGLLKVIQSVLQDLTKESEKDKEQEYLFPRLTTFAFDIDKVADTVAKQFESSNQFPFEIRDGLSYATIHALDINEKTDFSHAIKEKIIEELRIQLFGRMDKYLEHHSLERYASSMLTPIDIFIKDQAIGLSYPLNKEHMMEKHSLHASNDLSSNDSWLKAHKLTLSVTNIGSFNEQIAQSITSYIEQYQGCDDDDIADVRENLATAQTQETSNLNQLKDIVIKESVARIYRDARVRYLRYLAEGMQEWKKSAFKQNQSPNAQELGRAIALLVCLVRRLQGLDAYIRQSDKVYSDYTVFLNKEEFNYRDLFARADAFNALPIIPEIDGFLGENTDQQRQSKTFTSGVKLKFNGQVHNHGGNGRSVFEFNTALLDPNSKEYQARANAGKQGHTFYEKVLKVALLYCFVFVEMEDQDFRPGQYFEKEILPALRSNDHAQAIAALQKLKQTITQPVVTNNLNLLKIKLLEFLRRAPVGPARKEYSLALTLDKNILTKDVNQIIQGNFFPETFDSHNGRNALKYIAVTKDVPDPNTLSKLSLSMTFEPIYYHPTNEQPEQFTMWAETKGIQVFPTFLAPIDKDAPQKYKDAYKDVRRSAFYYRHRPEIHSDSARAFVYRFTYTLLSYTMIKLLTDSLPSEQKATLFAPIICIHANKEQEPDEKGEKYDDETFMHSLSKQLAHMLGEDYTSGSQGFHVDTIQNDKYKLGNALYSLYSSLPHTFRLHQPANGMGASRAQTTSITSLTPLLKKFAIIVVSSRKSDENVKSPDYYESTIIGKVIGMERCQNDTITVHTLTTFSANQNSRELFNRPDVLVEQVKKYHQQGYQHFLYVARAPYTSTLNISDSGNKDLFFMNRDIIQAMRNIDSSIKIYPVFCDKYYVINRKLAQAQTQGSQGSILRADSLYIDDIGELTSISNDPSRRSQIFFNLFNGIKVNPNAIYNGVMSYATLINVYDNDPTYDQYIWNDLLNTSVPNTLKKEILDFITLLHFSRYEKASQKANPVGFKLDPYTDIIGDKSVGTLSVFPNMNGRARFNVLSFLTVVRAVMHANVH